MELPVSYLFTFTLFFLADLLESRLTTHSGSGLNLRLVMFGNQSEKRHRDSKDSPLLLGQ